MDQTLPNFAFSPKPGFLLLALGLLLSFQRGQAQHCFPGFHFTVNGSSIAFDDQSTADGDITAYSWDFGDGQTSTEQSPTHTYAEPGTYDVCLTITAHNPICTETYCHPVVVTHPPAGVCHAAFVAHQPNLDHQTLDFTDQSSSDGTIGTWAWDFGDGHTSSEQNPTHTYAEPGTYLVCLVVTNAGGDCTSHFCHHVVVHHSTAAGCHAAFVAHQPSLDHQTLDFTDQSSGDATIVSWTWDFGDGHSSTAQNPEHTYAEPGTYVVCLFITGVDGSCSSHSCQHVVVHHPSAEACHAAFTLHPDGSGYQLTNTSAGTTDHTTYSWEFGDGATSSEESPHHTYAHSGHYTVCLFITDATTGCSAHSCHNINVHHGGGHHYDPHPNKNEAIAVPQGEPNVGRVIRLINQMSVYPNPVTADIQVIYQIPAAAKIKFDLYSLTGARVLDGPERLQPAGAYTEIIPTGQLLSGQYVVKMTVDGAPQVRRIIVH